MFLTEDLQKAIAFGEFIKKHAHWRLTSTTAIDLAKHFAAYNTFLKKIEDHILEVQRVIKKDSAAQTTAQTEAS